MPVVLAPLPGDFAHASGLPVLAVLLLCPLELIDAVSGGWPKILVNLKSLLETGEVILRA